MDVNEILWLLLGLALGGWFWSDNLRSREQATRVGRRYCDHVGLQLLDDTVYLTRLTIGQSPQGLSWRRTYRFEFSTDGEGRELGWIVLLGSRVESVGLNGVRPVIDFSPGSRDSAE